MPMDAMPDASIAGMETPVQGMAGVEMASTAGIPGDESPREQAPCDAPWAPPGCELMAPCPLVAVTSLAPVLRTIAGVPLLIPADVELMPASQTRAPELPPPKA